MKEEWQLIDSKVKIGLKLTEREKAIYILFIATKEEAAKMSCMT